MSSERLEDLGKNFPRLIHELQMGTKKSLLNLKLFIGSKETLVGLFW